MRKPKQITPVKHWSEPWYVHYDLVQTHGQCFSAKDARRLANWLNRAAEYLEKKNSKESK